jgi:Flp pilus assembly protein TadD
VLVRGGRTEKELGISQCCEAIGQGSRSLPPVVVNCASAHGVKGAALVFAGRREEGRASLRAYLRLNPRDPARASRFGEIALSHYLDGDYAAAAEASRDVIRRHPNHGPPYRFLLAALGQLGRQSVKRS